MTRRGLELGIFSVGTVSSFLGLILGITSNNQPSGIWCTVCLAINGTALYYTVKEKV